MTPRLSASPSVLYCKHRRICSHPELCPPSPSRAVWGAALRLLPAPVPRPKWGVRHTGHQLVQLHQPLEQKDLLHHWETQSEAVSAPRAGARGAGRGPTQATSHHAPTPWGAGPPPGGRGVGRWQPRGSAGRRRVRRAFSLQDPSTCPTNPTGRSWSPRRPGREGAQRATGECVPLLGGHLPRAGVYVGSLHQGQGGCRAPHSQGALPLTLCADL